MFPLEIYDTNPNGERQILFSILVTTFDREELLEQCLDSCTSQSFASNKFEIIVCNDNPSRTLSGSQLGLTLINHSRTIGEINSINEMIALARGQFLIMLADDDLIHPQCLEILSKVVNRFPYSVAYFPKYLIGSSINAWPGLSSIEVERTPQDFIEAYLNHEMNNIIGIYGAIRTEAIRKLGGLRELCLDFSPYSDTLLPIELTRFGSIVELESSLFFHRTHPKSLSSNSTNIGKYLQAQRKFLSVASPILQFNNRNLDSNVYQRFIGDIFAVASRGHNRRARLNALLSGVVFYLKKMPIRANVSLTVEILRRLNSKILAMLKFRRNKKSL